MVTLLQEIVEDLRDAGAGYVGVDGGEGNEHLHRRDIILRAAPTEDSEASMLRTQLEGRDRVQWQGESWGLVHGVSPENVARQAATHDVYVRGEGTQFEALLRSWMDTWMDELAECPLDELADDKRWQFRAREVREASGYELSPRMCEVFALDEIGRSTEEIAEVLEVSETNVERRRSQIQERVGDRTFR